MNVAVKGFGALLLVACSATAEPEAGMETAACIDGSCFGDLECLSDLCVAPDGEDTEGVASNGEASASGPSSGSASATEGETSGNPTSPSTTASSNSASDSDPSDSDSDPSDSASVSDSDPSDTAGSDESSGSAEGCQRIDYLLVVDDSASTVGFQTQLVDALPDLVAAVGNVADNVHIGVVTTDAYVYNVAECAELGGLVVQTGGPDSSAGTCGPYANGGNYMTLEDELATSLSCAMRVGTGGDGNEKPMQAMLEATSGDLAVGGGCNEGFLRDNSLLVVVIVTDEYDGPMDPVGTGSPGSAPSWYADLISHRGLPETNIVVGVLTNYEEGECPPVDWTADGAEMTAFAQMFTYGVLGGICGDFSPFFADLGAAVTEACAGFSG